ncbi:MAG: hypothetical protein ACFFKA_14295, partial [Candidatus Thorarchaeota archaeon]
EKSIITNLKKLFPNSDYEWGIIVSWELMRLLGKVVSDLNYELRSRSWLDEWRLSKYIKNTLHKLSTDENGKLIDSILLIKLLISHQDWFKLKEEKTVNTRYDLLNVLSDPEIHQYLNFNRYQEVLWYNAESFDLLVRWLSVINIIYLLKSSPINKITDLSQIINNYKYYIETSNKSMFKVESLLNILK